MTRKPAPKNVSALDRAMLAFKKVKKKLDRIELARKEPIAIIGMACRFPAGADDLEGFWRALEAGVDGIREIDRWPRQPDAEEYPGVRWAGLLDFDLIEGFEPSFFGMSPREAVSLDPQQRVLLEVCWEALEHAGIAPDALQNQPVGVFSGLCSMDSL